MSGSFNGREMLPAWLEGVLGALHEGAKGGGGGVDGGKRQFDKDV